VTGHNFIEIATKLLLGKKVQGDYRTLELDYVAVKSPQFSYSRIKGADPLGYVEMGSTGEVACFGDSYEEALLKSMLSAGMRIPKKNILVSLGREENKVKLLPSIKKLKEMKYRLYATEGTAKYLREEGIECEEVHKIHSGKSPNIGKMMEEGAFDLIINIPRRGLSREKNGVKSDGFTIRRKAIDINIPLLTNRQLAEAFISALYEMKGKKLSAKAWGEYMAG
jgi:carbamoyl-phosphate synthase large subunit